MKIFLSDQLDQAASLLKKGELIAFPTETVFGLAAPYNNEIAIKKIFIAKGRPSDNPLIVHIADLAILDQLARDIPEEFILLTKKFWPGPLTIVLHKQPSVSSLISGGLASIAIRFPSHPIARTLIEKIGTPLVAPSANRSGRPSGTRVEHIIEDFTDIGGVIEGECGGIESTVISLLNPKEPTLLRPGIIAKEELEEALGCKIATATKESANHSPGMKYRHYAPKAHIRHFSTWKEIENLLNDKKQCIVSKEKPPFNQPHFPLSRKELYATFREADRCGFKEILILDDQSDEALSDRLCKAETIR